MKQARKIEGYNIGAASIELTEHQMEALDVIIDNADVPDYQAYLRMAVSRVIEIDRLRLIERIEGEIAIAEMNLAVLTGELFDYGD